MQIGNMPAPSAFQPASTEEKYSPQQHLRPDIIDEMNKTGPAFDVSIPLFFQIILIFIAVVIFIALSLFLKEFLSYLNNLHYFNNFSFNLQFGGILLGITVYLKTSFDFAFFIGRLMERYPGWFNRLAIETGTAIGNFFGILLVLFIWLYFQENNILFIAMIFIASLILFELSYSGLAHISSWKDGEGLKKFLYQVLEIPLHPIVRAELPLLGKALPNLGQKFQGKSEIKWFSLLLFTFTVPFILGADDFAGYIPLFKLVNIYSFAVGILLAHTLLNIFLFSYPAKTISLVKNQYVSYLGNLLFALLGVYGLIQIGRIIALSL